MLHNPEQLRNMYWQRGLSIRRIAIELNISPRSVWNMMLKYHVPRRPAIFPDKYKISRETLETLYIKQKLSLSQTANRLGVSSHVVHYKLRKFRIPTRTKSQGMIRHPKSSFSNIFTEKAYMLGLRAGDLYACKHYNHIRLTSTTTHPAFVTMMGNAFANYANVGTHRRYNKDHYEWVVYTDLHPSFDFLLCKPRKLPEQIINGDAFWHFLAGYVDCEGSWIITKSNKDDIRFMFRIGTYDRTILRQIQNKLRSDGYASHLYLDRKQGSRTTYGRLRKDFYVLRLYCNYDIIRLIKKLLPLSRHDEKVRKMQLILQCARKKWSDVRVNVSRLKEDIKNEVIK